MQRLNIQLNLILHFFIFPFIRDSQLLKLLRNPHNNVLDLFLAEFLPNTNPHPTIEWEEFPRLGLPCLPAGGVECVCVRADEVGAALERPEGEDYGI